MLWFSLQSLLMLAIAFSGGVLVGWLLWAHNLPQDNAAPAAATQPAAAAAPPHQPAGPRSADSGQAPASNAMFTPAANVALPAPTVAATPQPQHNTAAPMFAPPATAPATSGAAPLVPSPSAPNTFQEPDDAELAAALAPRPATHPSLNATNHSTAGGADLSAEPGLGGARRQAAVDLTLPPSAPEPTADTASPETGAEADLKTDTKAGPTKAEVAAAQPPNATSAEHQKPPPTDDGSTPSVPSSEPDTADSAPVKEKRRTEGFAVFEQMAEPPAAATAEPTSPATSESPTAAAADEPASLSEPASPRTLSPAPSHDDLTLIDGVTRTTAKALAGSGYGTFAVLATATPDELRTALGKHDITSTPGIAFWPSRARQLAGENGGFEVSRPTTPPPVVSELFQPANPANTPPGIEVPATVTAATPTTAPTELERVIGINTVIAQALENAGIATFSTLALASHSELAAIVVASGMQPPQTLATWPAQAALLLQGDSAGAAALVSSLMSPESVS